LGANLVAISPQVPEYLHLSEQKNGLHFEVLGDPGNRVAGQFGLVFQIPEDLKQVYAGLKIDLQRVNGDDSWQLPMTSRFIIDRAGIIRSAEFHPDYTIRPDPSETLAALRAVVATP
jgi:peroxiredoxin